MAKPKRTIEYTSSYATTIANIRRFAAVTQQYATGGFVSERGEFVIEEIAGGEWLKYRALEGLAEHRCFHYYRNKRRE